MAVRESEILERLYASEINACISWIWDGGFDVKLGFPEVVRSTSTDTFAEAVEWLAAAAFIHYPYSDFAIWWGPLTANYAAKHLRSK